MTVQNSGLSTQIVGMMCWSQLIAGGTVCYIPRQSMIFLSGSFAPGRGYVGWISGEQFHDLAE
jgi:hypothetical protein